MDLTSINPEPWMPLLPICVLYIGQSLTAAKVFEWQYEQFGQDNALLWNGISSGVSGFLTFLCAPVIGAMSDSFGRKPFIVFACIMNLHQSFSLLWYRELIYYQIATGLLGIGNVAMSMVFVYQSDLVGPEKRTVWFGLTLAILGVGFTGGPFLGVYMAHWFSDDAVVWTAFACCLFGSLGCLLLPESLPRHLRIDTIKWSEAHVFHKFAVISHVRILQVLAVVVFLGNISESGVISVLTLYLGGVQGPFHFNGDQVSLFLAILGVCTMISQGIVLRVIRNVVTDTTLVHIAYFFNFVHTLFYGVANKPWQAYCNLILTSIGELGFVSISGLVSNSVPQKTRGAALTALTGVRQLTNGIGPVIMGLLFSKESHWPWAPAGFPFLVMATAVFAGFCVSFMLRSKYVLEQKLDVGDVDEPLVQPEPSVVQSVNYTAR